jgi:hypothetical protein
MLRIHKPLSKKRMIRIRNSKNIRLPKRASLKNSKIRLMQSQIRRTSLLKVRESEKKKPTTKRNKQEMRSSTISKDSCSTRKVN